MINLRYHIVSLTAVFLAIGIALLATVAAGSWWGRSFIRRIFALTHATDALAAGQMDARVPLTGRDEIAQLRFADAAHPCHAAELLPVIFRRPLDLHQTTFAMGEAIAHLHALWHAGRLTRTLGEDGVFRFSAS